MTLKELADAVVDANKSGTIAALLDAHYADTCLSVEAVPMGDGPRAVEGLDAIRGKHDWWNENMEMLGGTIEGPYLHGDDRFALVFKSQIKDRRDGSVSEFEEVAVYHVADEKIVREEFFYTFG